MALVSQEDIVSHLFREMESFGADLEFDFEHEDEGLGKLFLLLDAESSQNRTGCVHALSSLLGVLQVYVPTETDQQREDEKEEESVVDEEKSAEHVAELGSRDLIEGTVNHDELSSWQRGSASILFTFLT